MFHVGPALPPRSSGSPSSAYEMSCTHWLAFEALESTRATISISHQTDESLLAVPPPAHAIASKVMGEEAAQLVMGCSELLSVQWGEQAIPVLFGVGARVKDLVESVQRDVEGGSSLLGLWNAATDERHWPDIQLTALAGQELHLRPVLEDTFRAVVLHGASVWRGFLAPLTTAQELAERFGGNCCRLLGHVEQLNPSMILKTSQGARPLVLEVENVLIGHVQRVCKAVPIGREPWLVTTEKEDCIGVLTEAGCTGAQLLAAIRVGKRASDDEEVSLVGAEGRLADPEAALEAERLGRRLDVRLQTAEAADQVLAAAQRAFGGRESEEGVLDEGELLEERVDGAQLFDRLSGGKLGGTLLLTTWRLVFVPLNRSSYRPGGIVSLARRSLLRVSPVAGAGSGFWEVAARTFRVHVLCLSRTGGQLLEQWVAAAWTNPPWALLRGREDGMERERDWLESDYRRLGLDDSLLWRLSTANGEYQLCSSYPRLCAVPISVDDEMLEAAAGFRSKGRFVAVVWQSRGGAAVLARASQPLVGMFKRSVADEQLVAALGSNVVLVDSRPVAAAVAHKLTGGGSEQGSGYAECRYIGIPNVHALREAYLRLHALCLAWRVSADQWLPSLHATGWLQNVQWVLDGAATLARTLAEGRTCLTHCSDGWDRTSQLTSLAQLMLDPYYRSLEGFPRLVHKEWLSFGHRFETRSGARSKEERDFGPIFLLFLDCVYQMQRQFKSAFEFGSSYLVVLLEAQYSGQYGTFLFDSEQERIENHVYEQCQSVWDHLELRADELRNPRYVSMEKKEDENAPSDKVYDLSHRALIPKTQLPSLHFWSDVYLR